MELELIGGSRLESAGVERRGVDAPRELDELLQRWVARITPGPSSGSAWIYDGLSLTSASLKDGSRGALRLANVPTSSGAGVAGWCGA